MLAMIPPGRESDEFLMHLQRMGCRVEVQWPPPPEMPADLDIVFVAVRPLIEDDIAFAWSAESPPAALIAVVDYENPLIVEATLHLRAQATIGMPFRPFGVLIDVLLSVANFKREKSQKGKINKLNAKIKSLSDIEKAKEIVAGRYNVSGDIAYKIIRNQAMNKRATVESIVSAIMSANEIMNLDLTEIANRKKV